MTSAPDRPPVDRYAKGRPTPEEVRAFADWYARFFGVGVEAERESVSGTDEALPQASSANATAAERESGK